MAKPENKLPVQLTNTSPNPYIILPALSGSQLIEKNTSGREGHYLSNNKNAKSEKLTSLQSSQCIACATVLYTHLVFFPFSLSSLRL